MISPSPAAPPFRQTTRPHWRAALRCALVALLAAGSHRMAAQTLPFDAAPPGVVETGTPAFVVLGPEAMGLSAPPTDLQAMPDGRILAIARNEIALGDGVRWEIYRQADTDERPDTASVAIGPDGRIFAGVQAGIAEIRFGADARWRFALAARLPDDGGRLHPVLTNVAMTDSGWYWHSESGAVFAWQPGQPTPKCIGGANTIERVFAFGDSVFICSSSDGALFKVTGDAITAVLAPENTNANHTITCGTPFDADHLLLGTNAEGLMLFDGTRIQPLTPHGLLASILRINDLCSTSGGIFAAAVDNVGIVFFDRSGRVLQVLDRSLDHRFSRVQRLLYSSGVLWALLNDGVARVRFPSRLSNFEPHVTTGLAYAQPIRHDGRLWLLADGRAQRGIYTDDGRLLRFENDSPPGSFVHSLSVQMGPLLAGTEQGLFRREGDNWVLAVPDLAYPRVDVPSADGRRWFYVARGEIGWLCRTGDTITAQRFPQREVADFYDIAQDAAGQVWVELGTGRTGRIDLSGEAPALEIFGPDNGVADGWVNVFILDGQAHFNIANHIFRFDEGSRRLVEDTELLHRYPSMASVVGRPTRDAQGRLWMTTRGSIQVLADTPDGPMTAEHLSTGALPSRFTVEKGGVVWLHETRRLARYDPSVPEPPTQVLQALITRVQLTASDRNLFPTGPELPELSAADNSLVVHFLAPANSFGQPVTFEIKLDGAGTEWISTGSTGSAALNRLKEGRYTLHVRPRAGSEVGREASLAFTIRPPWYRTVLAYVLYCVGSIGLLVGAAWWFSYLERREKARLEQLVAQRTLQLGKTNRELARQVDETMAQATALQASEDRYRRLSEDLEHRVQERTAELTASNHELESFSYSVSHDLRAPLRNISGFADLLRKRLQPVLDAESTRFLGIVANESIRLGQLIDCLLSFSRLGRTDLKLRRFQPAKLVEEARHEFASEIAHRQIEFHLGPLPEVQVDPTLLRQVLVNLIGNAIKFTRERTPALIEIGSAPADASPREYVFFVRDNGAGFDPKYSDKLFGVFQRLHHARDFEGTGIGLANVKRIVVRHGGRVWAEGEPGRGATFYFTLPVPAPRTPVA